MTDLTPTRPPSLPEVVTVIHTGDLGDIIYCLPGLRWLAAKHNAVFDFMLIPANNVREPMTLARAPTSGGAPG